MILADFSHLVNRMLFIAIDNAKRSGLANKFTANKKLHVDSYKNFFLHLLFSNFAAVKKEHEDKYGEVVICVDSAPYWRKRILSSYKGKRKDKKEESEIDYDSFYEMLNETLETINNGFPFKVVRAKTAEADDVIAVLTKKYHKKEKILIISSDKDFRQLLRYNDVTLYDPIQKIYREMSKSEVTAYRAYHNVLGDAGDEVPTIKTDTEFSLNFIKYLRENGIHELDVRKFNKLNISKKLYDEYDVVDKKGNLDIFKAANFGDKKAQEFVKNLRANLKEKKIYYENYKRNRDLVSLMRIPKDIQEIVLKSYDEAETNYNPLKITGYFQENRLRQLSENVQVFFTKNNEIKATKGMFDLWS